VTLVDQRQRIGDPAAMHRLHDLLRPLPAIPGDQLPGGFERRQMLSCVAAIPSGTALNRWNKAAGLVVSHVLHADPGRQGQIVGA
jgi:hypothetical protein